MPFFRRSDDAEECFKKAMSFSYKSGDEDFDLDKAISLFEEAVTLKPNKKKYREMLEQIQRSRMNFSLQVEDIFLVKGTPTATGRVQQGMVRKDDEVHIIGSIGDRKSRVDNIQLTLTKRSFALPGDYISLSIPVVIERGDTIQGVRE